MTGPIRIDALPAALSAELAHLVPAMKDGATVAVSVEQIRDLIVAAIVGDATAAFDTLGEIQASLGDDADLAATLTSAIAGKMAVSANGSDINDVSVFLTNLGVTALIKSFLAATDTTAARGIIAAEGRIVRSRFSSSGTYNKSAGLRRLVIRLHGPGGGGGGANSNASEGAAGAGGGGGGYTQKEYDAAEVNATENFVIGAGGPGGTAGNAGSDGGNSTFKGLTAGGGKGGPSIASSASLNILPGGRGGVASGGDVNANGQRGSPGVRNGNASLGGDGGAGVRSAGGQTPSIGSDTGASGGPGSGGSGAASYNNDDRAGGPGGDGWIEFEEYF